MRQCLHAIRLLLNLGCWIQNKWLTQLRDLSEISRGEGGSQLFETGGVMKNGPLKGGESCKYVSVIM